jgi:hypothetical protein
LRRGGGASREVGEVGDRTFQRVFCRFTKIVRVMDKCMGNHESSPIKQYTTQ